MTAQQLNFSTPTSHALPDAPSDFGHGSVTAWMAPLDTCVSPETPLSEAIRVMLSSDCDHLVVTDAQGELSGLICYRALLALVADGTYGGPDTIESLIDTTPTKVRASSNFTDALKKLDPPDVTCVIVVQGRRPVGIISESHLARPTLALVASSL